MALDKESKEKVIDQAQLIEIVESWKGTPYRHFTAAKKRGADCATLMIEIYREIGIIPKDYRLKYYPVDWHIHKTEKYNDYFLNEFSKLQNVMPKHKFSKVTDGTLEVGDWLAFCLCDTNQVNHSAIYIGDRKIFHSINNGGTKTELFEKYRQDHRATFRLKDFLWV